MNHLCSYSKVLLVSTTNFTQQKWRSRGVLVGLKMVLTQHSEKEFHGGKTAKAKSVVVPATRFQSVSCEPTGGCRQHTTFSRSDKGVELRTVRWQCLASYPSVHMYTHIHTHVTWVTLLTHQNVTHIHRHANQEHAHVHKYAYRHIHVHTYHMWTDHNAHLPSHTWM